MVLFFLLRLPVGYVRQTVTAASAYITDSTAVEGRTVALGRVQMIMSASFLVGPICSGISAQRDPTLKLPIYIATAFFVLEMLALYYVLPDSRTLSPPTPAPTFVVPAGHPSIKPNADGKMPIPCPFAMNSAGDKNAPANGGAASAGANANGAANAKPQSKAAGDGFWSKLKHNMLTLTQYVRYDFHACKI